MNHKIFYNHKNLDRLSFLRKDVKKLKKIIRQKNTKFIPIWGNLNFFVDDLKDIKPFFCNFEDLKNVCPAFSLDELVFLGKTSEIFYFSIDLRVYMTDIPKELSKGKIIVDELRTYVSYLTEIESSYLALAKGMSFWHLNNKFCGICGSKNLKKEAGFVLKCINLNCAKSHFPRTDPAIITLVSYENEILLARSSRFPDKMYSTLAGFVEPGETLELALKREVYEEVGLNVKNIRYFQSQPWPFPASLMLGFFAVAKSKELKIDNEEIEDAQWFNLDQLLELKHPQIINGFKLPRCDSIARRLVNDWLHKNGN